MIAVLRYKEGILTNDGSILFYVVSKHNAEVIKTTSFLCGGRPKVTIKVSSQEELSDIVREINKESAYTVSVVKTYK